jgi:hypothetical protein
VYRAAASGLSLSAASAAFHAVLPVLHQQWPAARSLVWLLAAVSCSVLWPAVNKILVMAAVKASDRTVIAEPAGQDLTDLLTAADAALYAAKTGGRNTVQLAGDTGQDRELAGR